MNDLLKSVKETVIDRVRNPFFFCFILSWLFFNWQSVLIVTLSKKPIEERIAVLAGKLDPWHLNSLILPAFSAFIIAVAFPYLGVAIRFLHLQYENISEGFVRKQKTRAYETISHVAQSKVKSDNAEELEKAKIATKLAEEDESQLKSKLNLDALNTHYETLNLSIETLEKQIKSANETISTLSEKSISLQNEINESENILVGLKGKIKESNRKEGQSTTKQRNTTVAETLGSPAFKDGEYLANKEIMSQVSALYNPVSDLPNNLKELIKIAESPVAKQLGSILKSDLNFGNVPKELLEGAKFGEKLNVANWGMGKGISAIPPMINSLKYIDPTKNPEDSDLPAKDDT
ncbi:TPA: hypothetical protein U5E10_001648 [Yersinia enterocolitica]|nr:hypothetical protein [Yersinia enterocolitica]HEK5866292.1 hypothetical protein [Yersinia enterocolitica]HEN3531755.1 hypothetical protein [Yersinia enterocolitica]HEP1966041.1 hypothetical protein [Yersinia enterocolitica]